MASVSGTSCTRRGCHSTAPRPEPSSARLDARPVGARSLVREEGLVDDVGGAHEAAARQTASGGRDQHISSANSGTDARARAARASPRLSFHGARPAERGWAAALVWLQLPLGIALYLLSHALAVPLVLARASFFLGGLDATAWVLRADSAAA
jgi:hypothetical protein